MALGPSSKSVNGKPSVTGCACGSPLNENSDIED